MRTSRPLLCVAVLVTSLFGCTAANDDYGPNGPDLISVAPDGAEDGATALTCDAIKERVTAALKASTACKVDADCELGHTACGLPGACTDVYVAKVWRTAEIERILGAWKAQMCGAADCPCPKNLLAPPACNEGVCGAKRAGGVVGAACKSNADCASGQCVTQDQDKSFVDGYCTVKDCGVGNPCPSGSECRGASNNTRICLATCSRATGPCRTGYGCCSGPGPGRDVGWCSPERSGLCLAR